MRLEDLASVIRSKNAGPFSITFDIMFRDPETYRQVIDSHAVTAEAIADMYQQPLENIQVFNHELARAIKITLVRPTPAGSIHDADIYGTQQHVPLYGIEVPI